MKGLLKNNFYGAVGSASIQLLVFLVLGSAMLIFKSFDMLYVFVICSFILFPCSACSNFRKEAACKWNKYELAAPVRRRDIIKSRYLCHLAWTLAAAALCAAYIGISVLIHGNRYFYDIPRDPIALFALTGMSLLVGAFYFPMAYSFGADKSELAQALSIIASVGVTLGILWLINPADDIRLSDLKYYLGLAVYDGIVIVTFILSYFLTTFIYSRKEY